MSDPQTNLPLPQYYARTLAALLPVLDDTLPLADAATQAALARATDDLYLISRMLTSLGVFSDNESLDELGDRELVFMSVPWVLGEAEARRGLGAPDMRTAALRRSETALHAFLALLSTYGVLGGRGAGAEGGGGGEASAAAPGALPLDPAKRREAKIQAYGREKELRESISGQLPGHPAASSSPLAFIAALLPAADAEASASTTTSTSVNAEEPELRGAALQVLRLLAALAGGALANTAMELAVLAHAPPEPVQGPLADPRTARKEDEDTAWRLDRKAPGAYAPRELISGGGRVLQPFTILPSTGGLSERERLRSEVFRSSHRLPTMTIDEYLAEEDRRGNIIRGGGQASYDAPTESELLELEAENDGSAAAEAAEEKKRLKEEKWAQYTDENQKGAGNTLNRG